MLIPERTRTDQRRSGFPQPVAVTASKMRCHQPLRRGANPDSTVGSPIECTLNPLERQCKARRNKFHERALFERL